VPSGNLMAMMALGLKIPREGTILPPSSKH
jgi:hypothetical protein